MIIRKLEYSEINIYAEKILELLIETYMTNFDISNKHSTDLSREKLKLLETYIKEDKALLIGACESEVLVGFVWLHKHDFFDEKRLHVNQIAVDGHYRGNGIGKQLINEAEKQALREDIKTIDLFVSEINSGAYNLYDKLGFETERRYMKKKL